MNVRLMNPQVTIPFAVAALGFVLPEPANVTAFVAALGIGLGIGAAAVIDRVSRARTNAFKEWDAAHRDSSLKQVELANDRYNKIATQFEQDHDQLLKMQADLDAERVMNEKLRKDLLDFTLKVLQDKGYVVAPTPTSTEETHS